MTLETLTALLNETRLNVQQCLYADALRTIREAKIIDLHNIYLSALEHCISLMREHTASDASSNRQDLCMMFSERALVDCERRMVKHTDQYTAPDQQTLEQEKIKNLYFQRTDELLERNEYERALEEVRRIYMFDPANIVAHEYEQKIGQMIVLKNKNE